MKSKIIVFSTIAFSMTVFAASTSHKNTSTSSKFKETSGQKSYISVPSALYISKSPFDLNFGTSFLAPVEGTELVLNLSQSQAKFESTSESGKSTSTNDFSMGTLGLAHAFNSKFFLSGGFSFGQSTGVSEWESNTIGNSSRSKSKSQGVSDPTITAGGRIQSESVTIIGALTAKIKTGDAEDKDTSKNNSDDSSSESNLKLGGNVLIPSVTVHTNSSKLVLGGKVAYAIMLERTSKYTDNMGQDSISKQTGGNAQMLSLFLEAPVNSLSFGGSLDYSKIERSKYKEEGVADSTSSPASFSTLTAFMNVGLADRFNLTPSVSYGQFGEGFRGVSRKDFFSAGVVGKTTF